MGRAYLASLHPGVLCAYVAAMALASCVLTSLPLQCAGLLGASVLCLGLSGRAGAPLLAMALGLAAVLTVVNPLFNTSGATVLCWVLGRPYTAEALALGAQAGVMAASVLLWLACLGRAVGVDRLRALGSAVAPRLGMVVGLTTQMASRFDRAGRRVRAARRGAAVALDGGSAEKRWAARRRDQAREGAAVLSTVVADGLESAMATADSMEARGFGIARPTSIDRRALDRADKAFIGAAGVLAAGAIASALAGAPMMTTALFGALSLLPAIVMAGGEARWLFWRRSI